MGEAIAAMPDGTYHGEGWVDTDGFDALDIPIKVAVTVEGDRASRSTSTAGTRGKGWDERLEGDDARPPASFRFSSTSIPTFHTTRAWSATST